MDDKGLNQIFLNDFDARLMKSRDGKLGAYNGQIGVDTKHHLIASSYITDSANELNECVDNLEEELALKPVEIVADKGYSNLADIIELEESGIECHVPTTITKTEQLSREKGISFKYHKDGNYYTCSQGKTLHLHAQNIRHGKNLYDQYKCNECGSCSIKDDCTKSKSGRTLKRNHNEERIETYKEKIKSYKSKRAIKERKGIVEHPFGTIKLLMGKHSFLLIGKEKVAIEWDLYTTVYNIKRIVNIKGNMTQLIGEVCSFSWKIAS